MADIGVNDLNEVKDLDDSEPRKMVGGRDSAPRDRLFFKYHHFRNAMFHGNAKTYPIREVVPDGFVQTFPVL